MSTTQELQAELDQLHAVGRRYGAESHGSPKAAALRAGRSKAKQTGVAEQRRAYYSGRPAEQTAGVRGSEHR